MTPRPDNFQKPGSGQHSGCAAGCHHLEAALRSRATSSLGLLHNVTWVCANDGEQEGLYVPGAHRLQVGLVGICHGRQEVIAGDCVAIMPLKIQVNATPTRGRQRSQLGG